MSEKPVTQPDRGNSSDEEASSPEQSTHETNRHVPEFQDETKQLEELEEKKNTTAGGRRKINIEFIENKSRRHVTFSKRKTGLIKKAYELSTLTGTQVLLLIASETGNVYTFATPKLQPLITKPEGKTLIQSCLNPIDSTVSTAIPRTELPSNIFSDRKERVSSPSSNSISNTIKSAEVTFHNESSTFPSVNGSSHPPSGYYSYSSAPPRSGGYQFSSTSNHFPPNTYYPTSVNHRFQSHESNDQNQESGE